MITLMKDKPTIAPISPIDEVKNAIAAWATLIADSRSNAEAIIVFLNQGFCINISASDFAKWFSKKPLYIHAYPAIFDTDSGQRLKFVLIDSSSDFMEQDTMEHISVKEFHYGESTDNSFETHPHYHYVSIPLLEALHRNFIWKMYCKDWLSQILNDQQASVFKAICIPFTDFAQLFTSEISDPSAIAFLGLTNTTINPPATGQYTIEFILTNEHKNYRVPSTFYDISRPVPPFDGAIGLEPTDFSLLVEN